MCGILTYFNRNGITRHELSECLDALKKVKHRGPDGEGIVLIDVFTGDAETLKTDETPADILCDNIIANFADKKFHLLLGHRRLSIFDVTSRGHQPMRDAATGNWLIFNGEIYNFYEIREELKQKGYAFHTGTDTEVILSAYREWKENCLSRFNGMWAFVLWDNEQKKLFVSNDRFGVKPVYYLQNENELIFTSELKQFFSFAGRMKGYDFETMRIFLESAFLDFDERTFFSKVKRFKKAHYALVKTDHPVFDFKPYYQLQVHPTNSPDSDASLAEEFKFLLKDSTWLRLRSDVDWGVTVSGGLDSSAILYVVGELETRKNINTFSAIFPGKAGDESSFIRLAIKDLKVTPYFINPMETFSWEDFEKFIYYHDTPPQSTSFYAQWSVARVAREAGIKIMLNGQGSDEIFAGYHHHFYRFLKSLIFKGNLLHYFREVNLYAEIKSRKASDIHRAVGAEIKMYLQSLLGFFKFRNVYEKEWYFAKSLAAILKLDLEKYALPTYLKSDDRTSMAFGIEGRHPFLDYRLVDFAFRLPDDWKIKNGWQKWAIRKHLDFLPEAIRYRKDKKGYTTPEEEWIARYKNNFVQKLGLLDTVGIEKKHSFRHYALATWLDLFKL